MIIQKRASCSISKHTPSTFSQHSYSCHHAADICIPKWRATPRKAMS